MCWKYPSLNIFIISYNFNKDERLKETWSKIKSESPLAWQYKCAKAELYSYITGLSKVRVQQVMRKGSISLMKNTGEEIQTKNGDEVPRPDQSLPNTKQRLKTI